jgi:predicted nucleic acid-binding protein
MRSGQLRSSSQTLKWFGVRSRHAHPNGLHFYDGMIVAAAQRAGCGRIWSEDFNPGQKYFGVTVTNPFE